MQCVQLVLPTWLQAFLTEKFFNACVLHEDVKKNEKNIFCLDCCDSICPHCLRLHRSHRLLQIRRYVYNDVIRLGDAQKLFDCSFVQSYTTNSAKVVFLKERPQTRQFRGSANNCATCDRSLQEPYLFCSLSCKIDHIVRTQGPNKFLSSGFLLACDHLPFPDPDWFVTADSVLQPAGSMKTSSESEGKGEMTCRALSCTAASSEVMVRRKRSTYPVTPRNFSANRRKNTPSRAPLY